MKKLKIFLMILMMTGAHVAAAKDSAVEIEIDPIAYALGGYSVHLGAALGRWKLDVGVAAEDLSQSQTESLLANKNFKAKFKSYGAKIDFIGQDPSGWHFGLQWDSSKWTYSSVTNAQSVDRVVEGVGLRAGYRFGKDSFYINPWVAVIQNYKGAGDIDVGGQTYKQPAFQVFPTVHLGFRF